ncbi:hypothetical protein [Pedococcus sp. 5OH_020]|uniref:hypothetical protein n=1 Tax=Pedococcus sp. 5OH_020 TaxID=2989814 RepID=UPI0022E9E79D|nr:hypothetical protein [Pedococcus sp. 5OH_020]
MSEPRGTGGVEQAHRPGRFRAVAALVCAVEAVVLLAFCAFYLWELARGEGDDPSRTVMSAVLIALTAVALGLLGRAWWRGASWPNAPTVVWNLLLLPVAWSLVQGDRAVVGALVALVALLGIVAAVRSSPGNGGTA